MEQIQYNPSDPSQPYRPVKAVDYSDGLDRQQRIFQADESRRSRAGQLSDNNKAFNAKNAGKDMEALSNFSSTLADYLKDEQEKKNQEDLQRGIMKAYYEGVPIEEQQQFEEGEQQLKQIKADTDRLAEKVEEDTGDVFVADRFRSMSGWERYGYAQGLVQKAAAGFPGYMQQARETAQIVVDGEIITFDNASTPEQYAALQAQVAEEFLKGFAGVNPALLNKYLFPTIQQQQATDAANWAQEQRQLRQQELKDERTNTVINTVSDPTTTPEAMSEFILNHPKGPAAGKRELAAIIEQGLKDGTIKGEDVLRIFRDLETTDDRGTGSLISKDIGIFGRLEDLAEDAIAGELDRETRTLNAELKETENEILRALREQEGDITPEERAAVIKLWSDSHPNTPLPDSIKDALTADMDVDKDEARIRLKAIEAERGYLTESDFKGMPDSLKSEFVIRSAEDMTPTSGQTDEAKAAIVSALDSKFNITQGDAPRIPAYREMERAARRDYERLFAQYINDGMTKQQAHEAAIKMIEGKIGPQTPYAEGKGFYATGADRGDPRVTERLNTHREMIAKDRESVTTTKYLSIQEMEEGVDYLKGKTTTPPEYAAILARSLGIPTYDLLAMQAQAHGIEVKAKRPPVEGEVDGLDPRIQRLLRYKPSVGRTTQAVSAADGDVKWFLDSVAAFESASHGEYDAMNTGGTGIGPNNQAYGSANSCDVTGCLSSMTIGEVMKLQSQGKVFAAGRYQFIPSTLLETAKAMNIPLDTPFDAATQDALAIGRLHWRLSVQNSLNGIRTEWQGLWHMPDAEAKKLLEVAREIVSVYNQPKNILPALRST